MTHHAFAKGTAIWLFSRFTNRHALGAIKARLTMFSNNAKRHEGTIIAYAKVVNKLIRPYVTDAIIAKADEVI